MPPWGAAVTMFLAVFHPLGLLMLSFFMHVNVGLNAKGIKLPADLQ